MPELTWELEETPCLLCKSTDSRAIARREQPRHVICRRCGMVYQNPRPTISSIMPYYNSGYWETRTPDDEARLASYRERGTAIVELSRNVIGADGLLVEVGCGHGEILASVRDQLGCQALGVEPSSAQCKSARERFGLEMVHGGLEEFAGGQRKANLLVLSHVLEHFHDPVAALAQCYESIVEGGWIFIEVPNVLYPNPAKRLSNWLTIEHMTYFSAATLGQMLTRAGFDVSFTECKSYVRAFAQKAEARPNYETAVSVNEYWAVRWALLRHEFRYWPAYSAKRALGRYARR